MKAKTRKNASKNNDRSTATPDLMGTLSKAQRTAQKKAPTAEHIATSIEEEIKKLQGIADILRGKA